MKLVNQPIQISFHFSYFDFIFMLSCYICFLLKEVFSVC